VDQPKAEALIQRIHSDVLEEAVQTDCSELHIAGPFFLKFSGEDRNPPGLHVVFELLLRIDNIDILS